VATFDNTMQELSCVNTGPLLPAWLIALAFVAACGDRDGPGDVGPRLELLPVAPSLEVLGFQASGGPAWLDDSTLVLLDRDEQQIVRLALSSGEIGRGGRKGSGPGEMENAIAIAARATGGVVVLDMRLNRVIEYDSDLVFTRSQAIPGMPLSVVSAGADEVRALWMTFRPEGPDPRLGTIDMETGDTRSIVRIFDASGLVRPEPSGPFEPLFVSAVQTPDNGVAIGIGNEYRIVELDSSGRIRSSFGRSDLEARPVTSDRIAARREAATRAAERGGPPPPALAAAQDAALTRPDPFFGPNAFATDAAGRVWVVTSRRGEHSAEIDVFAAGGRFVQTIELKDNVIGLSFHGDRLAVLVTRTRDDVEGFDGIDVYRVE
jgi:hypothetical protein